MISLPPELLDVIFRIATDNPARKEWENNCEIPPFDIWTADRRVRLVDEALRTKLSISRVCRTWHRRMDCFLYEHIVVRHGSEALALRLESPSTSSPEKYIGSFVRRISLPAFGSLSSQRNWTEIIELSTRRILIACPHTVFISRSEHVVAKQAKIELDGTTIPSISDVNLPMLRRVDWHNGLVPEDPVGRRGLPGFVWTLPTLEVLSISDEHRANDQDDDENVIGFPWSPEDVSQSLEATSLARIHTLRVDCTILHAVPDNGIGLSGTKLTNLRHLILNSSYESPFPKDYL